MHALYDIGRQKDKEVFKEGIRLSPQRIQTVVGFLQDINLGKTDLDSKGRAFETFMDSFFRGNFGQYFTPREIVSFIVSVLPIKHNSLVLDTSCGSGGFLLHALDKVRKHADDYYPDFETNADERQDHYKYWHDFAEKNLLLSKSVFPKLISCKNPTTVCMRCGLRRMSSLNTSLSF
jgi:type I restriction enzyme M protein